MAQRQTWFEAFLKGNDANIDGDKILTFHSDTQKENTENGLQIHRSNDILTKNITQCVMRKNDFTITHLDLMTQEKTILEVEIHV
jgi:cobalamin-dependent methionine synthase I